jgi:hypothetical protein
MLSFSYLARLRNYVLKKWHFPNGRVWEKKFARDIRVEGPIKDKFTKIYENNYWLNSESVSGSGSTVKYTRNLRDHLPSILRDFGVASIFDGPCGDFNWMRHLLPALQVDYIGGDIVGEIVENNRRKFSALGARFIEIDITADDLPQVDLMICRDCLFHLSFEAIAAFKANFLRSGIKFLLTSTHLNEPVRFANRDIQTGDFRLIDLFAAPFDFPPSPLRRIPDWMPPEAEKEICLWSREQLLAAWDPLSRRIPGPSAAWESSAGTPSPPRSV